MDWFLQTEKKYLWRSDWKDWMLVRFCLFALGMMTGVLIHKKAKKPVFVGALLAFVATVIPVVYKYIKVGTDNTQIY
ncbi:MAG: permease of phosphate ABC transporter [Oscillospiraceae bacterium]|nr:permease of phosphate ABC transporter [Oscillospiraceae bacterium]